MNPIRRTIAMSAAALVVAACTIALAGPAFACEYVVDSYTGSARCVDMPQPASGLSIAWLWIGLGVAIATAAAVHVARQRPLKRLPASAPPQANVGESTGLPTTRQARIPTPRTAEAEGRKGPAEPEKLPSSR